MFDQPPDKEIADEFGIQIVPEFPLSILVPTAAGIGASIIAGRRLRK